MRFFHTLSRMAAGTCINASYTLRAARISGAMPTVEIEKHAAAVRFHLLLRVGLLLLGRARRAAF